MHGQDKIREINVTLSIEILFLNYQVRETQTIFSHAVRKLLQASYYQKRFSLLSAPNLIAAAVNVIAFDPLMLMQIICLSRKPFRFAAFNQFASASSQFGVKLL
jgi:hypothetical protein